VIFSMDALGGSKPIKALSIDFAVFFTGGLRSRLHHGDFLVLCFLDGDMPQRRYISAQTDD